MKYAVFVLVLIVLVGCGDAQRYQIVSVGAGKAYRLDTKTGEIWWVDGTYMERVLTEEEWLAKEQK